MASIDNNASCMSLADQMSCEAQVWLAKEEARKNAGVFSQSLAPCERYTVLADREQEHALQKTEGASKKLCVTKTAHYQDGDWVQQFTPLMSVPEAVVPAAFDVQTRRR